MHASGLWASKQSDDLVVFKSAATKLTTNIMLGEKQKLGPVRVCKQQTCPIFCSLSTSCMKQRALDAMLYTTSKTHSTKVRSSICTSTICCPATHSTYSCFDHVSLRSPPARLCESLCDSRISSTCYTSHALNPRMVQRLEERLQFQIT